MKFREGSKKPNTENVNFLVQTAGMGDTLCALVPILYTLKNVPHVNPLIWVPDNILEITKHVLPRGSIVRSYTEAHKKYNNDLTGVTNSWDKANQTAMRRHPVDHAFHLMLDLDADIKHKNYPKIDLDKVNLKKFSLPEKYVVIPLGATAKTKELHPLVIEQIASYVKKLGYKTVFLGKKISDTGYEGKEIVSTIAKIDYTKGIDLVDRTTVLEAAAIMGRSSAVIGMEGGLIHLAAFTDVPIIASYTFVNPDIMMPIRHEQKGWKVYPVIPNENLACRYCQSQWVLMFSHDFRVCYYNDYKCVSQITFEKFKEKIDVILKGEVL